MERLGKKLCQTSVRPPLEVSFQVFFDVYGRIEGGSGFLYGDKMPGILKENDVPEYETAVRCFLGVFEVLAELLMDLTFMPKVPYDCI